LIAISKKWIYALRLIVALVAYAYIVLKLKQQGFHNIIAALESINFSKDWVLFALAIGLMPIAWWVEAAKWKLAIDDVERVSISKAWQSVWYGVVAGLLTPNRVGEPFGRLFFFKPENRGKVALLGIWCGLAQQLATLLFGFLGLSFWLLNVNYELEFPYKSPLLIFIFTIVLTIVLLAFVKIDRISDFFQRFSIVKKLLSDETLFITSSSVKSLSILLLSIIRYSIFSTQLVLLLMFFGANSDTLNLYLGVFVTYLFASVIPSFAISEVIVRSSFALVFIGYFVPNPTGIVAATMALWLLNVAIPALTAAWFPWFIKTQRTDANH